MISTTLNQYKQSFKTNLLAFLNEYEDNTKAFFLQNEKIKYQTYQKALTKIADQMKFFTRQELNQNLVHRNIASDLKKLDINIYNSIITELNPNQDETVFSLSAAKNDRIKINETALENHIKSSIVILKFISEENTETKEINKFTYPSEDGETGLKFQTKDQLDRNLEEWLKIYEANFEYLPIPMIIDVKADYVTDTYKNYEQRYFEYQIEVCDIILNKVPNDRNIIDLKKQFQNSLIELRKLFPIPSVNIETIISDINNAFFRLENFMKGTVSVYQSFLFNDAFTIFFNELKKVENITPRNFDLRDGYHNLLYHIDYAFDKNEFKNQDAYENEDFERDCNEICYLHFYRCAEFGISRDLDDCQFEMPSIMEIVNDSFSGFHQNNDKALESKQLFENENNPNTLDDNKAKSHHYKIIIDIINHPSNILMQDENDDYLGLDENGIGMYKDTSNRNKYDEIKDIIEPFSNLESLTIELMNNTKHQKILDGYLKLIFREFMETAVIIIDHCNEYLYDSAKKSKSYPKDLEYFFYTYKSSLERYYDFIIEFLDDDFLKKENKIIVIDGLSYQTTNFPNAQLENQNNKIIIEDKDKTEIKVDLENPEPLVFKSYEAFLVFNNFYNKFGSTTENLSNYSFLYHKMQYDSLIHKESKQIAYFDFLSKYNISIDRIKAMNLIGKKNYREEVYSSCKK